jgi:hypothetical protein
MRAFNLGCEMERPTADVGSTLFVHTGGPPSQFANRDENV